jgi:flagellin
VFVDLEHCTSDFYSASKFFDALFTAGMLAGGLGGPGWTKLVFNKPVTEIKTTSGYDVTSAINLNYSGGTSAGLLATSATDVLSAAGNITAAADNVKASLGKIGNLLQTLDSRSDYLTSAIANNTATISGIFDADMAEEQLNATKGSIAGQVGMSIMSQLNTAPQQLLTLFR